MAVVTEFAAITMKVSGHPLPLVQCINQVVDYTARRKMIKCCIPASILGYELLLHHGYIPKLETRLQVFIINDLELSRKNIVGPPSPLSPGDVAIWHCWLSIYGKNINIGKTITQQVAREVEGMLLPSGHLVRLDTSYVGMFKRADLTTNEDIQTEAENIAIADRFNETVKKPFKIYKDAIANIAPGPLQ